jgi:hypothetical protein
MQPRPVISGQWRRCATGGPFSLGGKGPTYILHARDAGAAGGRIKFGQSLIGYVADQDVSHMNNHQSDINPGPNDSIIGLEATSTGGTDAPMTLLAQGCHPVI